MLNNCVFGTYRASATRNHSTAISSEYPTTIRIDNRPPQQPPSTVSNQLLRLIHGLRGIVFKILCQRRTMSVLAGFERMADKAVIVKYHRTIPCRGSAASEAQGIIGAVSTAYSL